jgi:REP element-mobilizing transposase RayT
MTGTYTKLYYHLVFSTKLRAGFITPAIEEELHRYLGGIVRGIGGTCLEINGMPDHVHMLVILPAKIAVSDALREIKASSSKLRFRGLAPTAKLWPPLRGSEASKHNAACSRALSPLCPPCPLWQNKNSVALGGPLTSPAS